MTTVSQYTHNTVPTQFVEADGIHFAYRRFGVPILGSRHGRRRRRARAILANR